MKKKALLIGARPSPFDGPWVPLDGGSWKVQPRQDLKGCVLLELQTSEGKVEKVPLIGSQTIVLRAKKLRARILRTIEGIGDIHLDVEQEA